MLRIEGNVAKILQKVSKLLLNCHINDTKGTGKGTVIFKYFEILFNFIIIFSINL